jgi:RNA polymerase sigma-70 factor (ECF subfamily)
MDDAGLASRFASGDADSVRVVYQSYGRLVFSIAFKVLGDTGLAEDATQQTFVQAWRRRFVVRPEPPPGSLAVDDRQARRHRRVPARAAVPQPRRRRHGHRPQPGLACRPSVDQMNDVAEVRRALDELPPTDRDLIRMQHFDELSHAEIARELEIPLGTVKSRTFRAHRRLAGLLAHLRAEPARIGFPWMTPT